MSAYRMLLKQITKLGLILIVGVAQAASFDCTKAATKVEHIICDNPEISKLDDELNATYKTAVQDKQQANAIKQAQKQWMKERNNCADADCVKRVYEGRLSLLKPAIPTPVALPANSGQSREGAIAAAQTACNDEDLRDGSNIRVQDIEGLYRQSVEGLPAIIGRPEEKLSGYNYLAITPLAGNKIRLRLSTKEINGHDCGIDSKALLCGRTIRLEPNEDELKKLRELNLPTPYLNITRSQIFFASIGKPQLYGWQRLYCGNMGSLNHSFKRSSRDLKIDNSIFNQ